MAILFICFVAVAILFPNNASANPISIQDNNVGPARRSGIVNF